MTHNELLENINKDIGHFPARSLFALRAVVELHKPDIPYGLHDAVEACPIDGDVYPCSTIRAIENELK